MKKLCSYFILLFTSSLFLHPLSFGGEFKYSGYGTAGILAPDFNFEHDTEFIGDFRLRAEASENVSKNTKVGVSYAIDELSVYQKKYVREGMAFFENKNLGRVEIGLTDSVAFKLGVGLPDVGGLRMNDNSFLFQKIDADGLVISNPLLSSGRYLPRINLVSALISRWQFGASASGITNKYKFSTDIAARYKNSDGKLKSSLAIGASFIDDPENFQTDAFSAPVFADFRAQGYVGLNLQYNSIVFGASVRAIYDGNNIGPPSDGIIAGAGLSYDILSYSVSGTYLMSAVGVWDNDTHYDHTGVLSFRYKYNEFADLWISGGWRADMPFISAGLRVGF